MTAATIDLWMGVSLAIVGLSHAAHPGLWARAFHALGRTGFAPFVIGTLTLPLGLALVVGHNIWARDWPVLVTLLGWAMTLKSALYLLFPALANRHLPRPDRLAADIRRFRLAGLAAALLGAALAWASLRG